jgi:tetratricopeptide (TPR) repeat protein
VLNTRAFVLLRQGQREAALPLIERGLDLARRLGQPHLTARLLAARSFAAYVGGDRAGAVRDAAESLRFFRQAGDRLQVGVMLGNLGNAELSMDDLDAARGDLLESLDIFRALNYDYGVVNQTFNLGLAEYLAGSPDTAERMFAETFDLAGRVRLRALTAYALIGLAMAGRGRGEEGRSARLHGAADLVLTALGHTLEPLEARLRDLDRQRLGASMGTEAFEAEYAAGRALTAEQVARLALAKL